MSISFLEILNHGPVLSCLNKVLDTVDVFALTQTCRETYLKWALSETFSRGFCISKRILERYKWQIETMIKYRKRMTITYMPETWSWYYCIGGCGKFTQVHRTRYRHGVCIPCAETFFSEKFCRFNMEMIWSEKEAPTIDLFAKYYEERERAYIKIGAYRFVKKHKMKEFMEKYGGNKRLKK